MFITVTLSNPNCPHYGTITITFPIEAKDYDECLGRLEALELSDPLAQDCKVEAVSDTLPLLDCLVGQQVNVDEVDFLARRTEGFWGDEAIQFEAMAYALHKTNIRDLINLPFCTQCVTVIQNFADLKSVATTHYLNLHGGSAPAEEVDRLDTRRLMEDLIASGSGIVTPYGVAFDNGMELRELYQGHAFPEYHDARAVLQGFLAAEPEAVNAKTADTLFFPMPDKFLPRALIRSGLEEAETLYLSMREESCPSEILEVIGNNWIVSLDDSVLEELNAMCRAVSVLSSDERNKLGAVIRFAQPQDAIQIMYLAENLDQFEFVADIHTPAEYARHLLEQSGALGNDETLQGFFDYEGYGKEQIKLYDGTFTERGYVAHHASITLEELMMDDPCEPGVMPAFQMRLDAISARKSASHKKGARKKGAPHKRETR